MQYPHTGNYENHMVLVEGNWVMTQSKNVILTHGNFEN